MKTAEKAPGLMEDLGTIAGLYRTVFWMMGKRIRYGQNWEERMAEETLKLQQHEHEAGMQGQPHPN